MALRSSLGLVVFTWIAALVGAVAGRALAEAWSPMVGAPTTAVVGRAPNR